MKKVDPNRGGLGGYMGANKLGQLGSMAGMKDQMSGDKLKYTQDVTISKNGFK